MAAGGGWGKRREKHRRILIETSVHLIKNHCRLRSHRVKIVAVEPWRSGQLSGIDARSGANALRMNSEFWTRRSERNSRNHDRILEWEKWRWLFSQSKFRGNFAIFFYGSSGDKWNQVWPFEKKISRVHNLCKSYKAKSFFPPISFNWNSIRLWEKTNFVNFKLNLSSNVTFTHCVLKIISFKRWRKNTKWIYFIFSKKWFLAQQNKVRLYSKEALATLIFCLLA